MWVSPWAVHLALLVRPPGLQGAVVAGQVLHHLDRRGQGLGWQLAGHLATQAALVHIHKEVVFLFVSSDVDEPHTTYITSRRIQMSDYVKDTIIYTLRNTVPTSPCIWPYYVLSSCAGRTSVSLHKFSDTLSRQNLKYELVDCDASQKDWRISHSFRILCMSLVNKNIEQYGQYWSYYYFQMRR